MDDGWFTNNVLITGKLFFIKIKWIIKVYPFSNDILAKCNLAIYVSFMYEVISKHFFRAFHACIFEKIQTI